MVLIKKFVCSEKEAVIKYQLFSKLYQMDRYKELYDIMQNIWLTLGFNERDYEDDSCFRYKNLMCYVDKENGSYCEVVGSEWFSMEYRVLIHNLWYNGIRNYERKKRKQTV